MNTKISAILVLVMSFVISGCASEQVIEPTSISTPTFTPILTQTFMPTTTMTPPPIALTTQCVKWNLTPEECANIGAHEYSTNTQIPFDKTGQSCTIDDSNIIFSIEFLSGETFLLTDPYRPELEFTRTDQNVYSGGYTQSDGKFEWKSTITFTASGFIEESNSYDLEKNELICTFVWEQKIIGLAVTKTPIPVSLAYTPVPRWMILGLPGQHIEIMNETWNYTNYRWGETYACIDYTREKAPYVFFEQCFALTQPDLTFESQRDTLLNDNYETLTPNNTFGDVGQISLMAKRLEDTSKKFVKFFEIIGIGKYILLVEMNFATDDQSPLQAIYDDQSAITIDYVLQNILEKSRLIPRPTATPLSPTQESSYATLGENLITETDASTLYGSTWEALGDFVDPENPMVCRYFEGRTNADVLWVKFSNCIYLHHPDFNFDDFAQGYKKSDNIFLESSHQYDDKFFLYYHFPKIYAWMIHGEYLYNVELESRTIFGEQNVEDVFTKEIDDFIYGVLMINAEK